MGNQNGAGAEVRKKHSASSCYSGSFMKLAFKEASKTFRLLPCRLPALWEWHMEEFPEPRPSALTRSKSNKLSQVT